jgi:hypothetical protein
MHRHFTHDTDRLMSLLSFISLPSPMMMGTNFPKQAVTPEYASERHFAADDAGHGHAPHFCRFC